MVAVSMESDVVSVPVPVTWYLKTCAVGLEWFCGVSLVCGTRGSWQLWCASRLICTFMDVAHVRFRCMCLW